MSIDLALAISSTGTPPSPAKGIAAIMPGAEAFAELMAGIAAPPEQQIDDIGTGANLRFNLAPAAVPVGGVAPEAIQPAVPEEPAFQSPSANKVSSLIHAAVAETTINAVPESEGAVPDLESLDDRPAVRRKQDEDEISTETIAAAPAGSPVIVPINVAPMAAMPEPSTKLLPVKTRGTLLIAGEAAPAKSARKSSDVVTSLVSILTHYTGTSSERGTPAPAPTSPNATAIDSRKGLEPVPASLTAVADIVQNLPPLIQSQVGATAPIATAAIGAPTDVGATLSGEVIDMGIGGQWIDRVAREITALAQGNGHSRFQLNPPNLGRLQIDVWQGEGGGRVQLLTETDEAAMRLRQDQASLQADARLSALSLDRIVIDRAPSAFGASQDQGQQTGAGRNQAAGGDAPSQTGSQSGSQAGQQTAAQHGGNGGSTAGQGKAQQRRDVFNEPTQPDGQDGRPSGRADDRHVRYA